MEVLLYIRRFPIGSIKYFCQIICFWLVNWLLLTDGVEAAGAVLGDGATGGSVTPTTQISLETLFRRASMQRPTAQQQKQHEAPPVPPASKIARYSHNGVTVAVSSTKLQNKYNNLTQK